MTYTIIIILIAFLIVCGIAATAIQQHNERKETEKREEVSKQRSIFDETEESIVAATQMPVSQLLIAILRKRSLNCLKSIYEHNPSPDVKSKIDGLKQAIKNIDPAEPAPDQNQFRLPSSDKVIIKYIQAVKKLRQIVRSEHTKGNISQKLFAQEDKSLESLQLRVNIETLAKRAQDAVATNMQGSARQYLEKALNALNNHKPQTEYTQQKKAELEASLNGLESSVKDQNLKTLLAEKQKESEEIEELFAPKKKW
ncbi:MAG: hypothetical protein WA981_05645 [Glaciecola sp.]